MLLLGLIAAVAVILYKRATEIVVVKPLDGLKTSSDAPDFASVVSAISAAAQQASAQSERQNRRRSGGGQIQAKSERSRAAIRAMVSNNQFYEAIELYKRVYGVDDEAAKRAVDEMMLQ